MICKIGGGGGKVGEIIDLIIKNARVIGGDDLVDIAIKGDKIAVVDKKVSAASKKEIDAKGRFVSPGFVDAHTHLDNAFVGGDEKWFCRTLREALNVIEKYGSSHDINARAKRAVEMALWRGTTSLRTHISVSQPGDLSKLRAILELKNELSDLMDIQVVSFITKADFTTSRAGGSLIRQAMRIGADVVGGAPDRDPDPEKYFDIIFKVADDFNAPIDLHVDETNDPKILTLETLAEKVVEYGYEGKVAASHCCSLSALEEGRARAVIKKVAKARMSVIANPLTNLYLWGENGRPEGVTRVKELLEEGVNVAYGTDNTQDAFNPLGNADMLLAALLLAYQKKLDGEGSLVKILEMGTINAAKATGMISNYGIREGGRADIVIFDAFSPREAIIRQARRLYVVKRGRVFSVG
jgi:cytosine deaminase